MSSPIEPDARARRRRSPRQRILAILGLAVLALVLLPLLVVLDSYRIVHDIRPLARKTPDRTAVMAQRLADPRTPRPLRYRPIRLGAVSPHLVHAVIVHEDATFYEHRGFDGFEIRAALRRSFAEREIVRGASTITTQVARTLYLGTDRSLLRKLREIPLTVRIEGALSKQRILELYLNVVEWGRGVFGAEAASRHHFGVSALDLTPSQAALLAAALPSPLRSTPAHPSRYLRRRAAIILARMAARGWLAPPEVDAARQELGYEPRMASAAAPGGMDGAGEDPGLDPELLDDLELEELEREGLDPDELEPEGAPLPEFVPAPEGPPGIEPDVEADSTLAPAGTPPAAPYDSTMPPPSETPPDSARPEG